MNMNRIAEGLGAPSREIPTRQVARHGARPNGQPLPKWALMVSLLLASVWLTPVAGAAVQPPQELIETTASQMLEKIKQEKATLKANPDRVYDLVNTIVVPHFDFELMAKRVLGKHWRDANPKQREEFVEAFKGVLVRTYANRLTEYTDYKIHYLKTPAETDPGRALVRSEVALPGQMPVQIDYRLLLRGENWKVYDVAIEGVSLVTNYRSSFNTEITQGGLDQLISRLQEPGGVKP